MSRLLWDQIGQKLYETGCDRGVVYPYKNNAYQKGAAWNGLEKVTESPSGAEPTALYANNNKYLNLISKEDYSATIEAYTYPDEFAECDGSAEVATGVRVRQQQRIPFGFTYRTLIGNDTEGDDHGYVLHIVYGATAKPASKDHNTVNDSPEAASLSWECSTVPVDMGKNLRPSATIEIDSTKCDPDKLAALEDILYGKDAVAGTNGEEGTAATDARLPLPAEIWELMDGVAQQGETPAQQGETETPKEPEATDTPAG